MGCEMEGHIKIVFLEEFSDKPFDELGKEVRRIANVIWDVLIETTDHSRFKERWLEEGAKCKADMVYETKMKSHKAWVIEFKYSGTWSTAMFDRGLYQTLNGQKINVYDSDAGSGMWLLCKKYHCIVDKICSSESDFRFKKREIIGIQGRAPFWGHCFIDQDLETTTDKTHPDIETNPALEDVIEEHYAEAKVWYDLNCVV